LCNADLRKERQLVEKAIAGQEPAAPVPMEKRLMAGAVVQAGGRLIPRI